VNGRRRALPGFELAGELVTFGWRALRALPRARAYAGEVLRQIALLASGSTMVIVFACFLVGQSCGLEAAYLARAISTPSLAAGATFGCAVLYIVPFLFGFVLAAKVGCGFVAEIGAMRVSEEIDALETLGISSLVYVVSARLLAAALLLPFVYLLAIAAADFGGFIQAGLRFADVSAGTYQTYRFAFFGPSDLILSLLQGLVIATVVTTVALYYGFTVRGGPVEVGVATAKSMTVNLVLVTWVNLVFVVLFLLKGRIPLA
jgi:phospholipid/cholesterol/gamma-HCH transport system permease protein